MLKGTLSMALVYGGGKLEEKPYILGFIDADFAADITREGLQQVMHFSDGDLPLAGKQTCNR